MILSTMLATGQEMADQGPDGARALIADQVEEMLRFENGG